MADQNVPCKQCSANVTGHAVYYRRTEHLVTAYEYGSPSNGRDVDMDAGVFCSDACCAAYLTSKGGG